MLKLNMKNSAREAGGRGPLFGWLETHKKDPLRCKRHDKGVVPGGRKAPKFSGLKSKYRSLVKLPVTVSKA